MKAAVMLATLCAVSALAQDQADAGVGTASELSTLEWSPVLDAFSEYQARWPSQGPFSNVFAVPRVHAGVGVNWHGAMGRVLLEGVYATQGGALVGVAGDSIVLRLREAWAGYRWRFIEGKVGLVPSLVVTEFERGFRYRQLSADGLETQQLISPADLAATLRVELPKQLGWLGAGVSNGEGYTLRELNSGKNVDVAAAIHPLPLEWLQSLTLVGFASFGSSGPASVPTRRLGGGLQWNGQTLGVGANVTSVQGWRDDGSRAGLLVQAFARAELFGHLLLSARMEFFQRNLADDDSSLTLIGAVGGKLGPVEGFVALQHTALSSLASAAEPGTAATAVRIVFRVALSSTFTYEGKSP